MTETMRGATAEMAAAERVVASDGTVLKDRDAGFVEVKENAGRAAAREMVVGPGGVILKDWSQVVDFGKHMAGALQAVSKPLRGNLGMCLSVIDLATRWGLSPWMLARQCYVVNDILCYDSQTMHAVVEKFAPLKQRLRPRYEGEGDTRTCTIIGHFKGEVDPLEYTSPPLGKINPKNSPLWNSDPDQQLWYFATRRWARRYCPDILMGAYAVDELLDAEPLHIGFDHAKDVSPRIAERLKSAQADEGFVGETTLQNIDAALNAARSEKSEKVEVQIGSASHESAAAAGGV